MDIIGIAVFVIVLYVGLSLMRRQDRLMGLDRSPYGVELELGRDRDGARLLGELDANVDHHPVEHRHHRDAA